ncbi:LOW QUALITY PROTEIN: rho GTPase-activating protein 20-like [Struthio camelus]|uniref:LOW QUALITY PROTEIN: rho GTPase-activating protein 20-like n=1 Tax=Struthio camelus TaxID=8801 RepID=UPI0036041B1F
MCRGGIAVTLATATSGSPLCGSTFRLKHRVRLSELWVLCRQEAAVAAGPEDDEEVFGLKCSQTLILVWPSSLCVVTFGSPEVKQLWLDAILSSWHSSGSRFASGLQRGSKRREVSGQLLAGRPGAPEALLCACLSRRPEVSLTAKTVEALVLAEADAKRGPPRAEPSAREEGLCHSAGECQKESEELPPPVLLANGPFGKAAWPATSGDTPQQRKALGSGSGSGSGSCSSFLSPCKTAAPVNALQQPLQPVALHAHKRLPTGAGCACFSERGPAFLVLAADGAKEGKKVVISWPLAWRGTAVPGDCPGQLGSGPQVALFGQPLALLCGEGGALPQPLQELLALLYEKGPATEGIFRKAATEKARRELKEDLDRGRSVDLASQPAHLLAAVLKDFLRNIPSKLLVAELYDKWLLALEKPGQQEKIEALREVAGKLPRANLLLLQRLLSVLHHISDNAESNRMDASNLAICVGPNMLSPDTDNLLPLAVHKESIDKVTLLVAFLIDNCAAVFGEDVALPLRPSADESPEHTDSSTERPCAAPQNTCACDSPEAGAAGSPPPSDMEQPKGGSASVSSSYPACASAPSLVIGKKDSSRMERSFSEPDLSFQASSLAGSRREPEAAKGEELFPRQLTKLRLEKRALEKRPCQLASTLSKSHSLPKIFSSRSLEPLLSSDGSLFPSSSLVSLLRPQKSYSKKTQAFPIKPAESTAGHLAERSDSAPGHCLLPAAAKRSKNTPHFGDLEDVRFPRASSSRKDNPFCCTAVQARRLDKNNPVKRFQGSAPIGKQNGKTCARIYMRGGPKHSSAFGCRRLARLRRNVGVLEAWKT